ncbi:MAG: hypothetical protein A2017_05530 [Lentisphaerae bacterium GWF2_44_16]|nr:MAG: hypothetical protein A2017_05530 [Lentisphaerae bacterium GWF2_44_16]
MKEKSGYNIRVTCTQDPTIVFPCTAKQRPGIKLEDKIDTTTDQSSGAKDFEPGDLIEITDAQITVTDDWSIEQKIKAILGTKGIITFASSVSGKSVAYQNAWFTSYTPDNVENTAKPTATITIASGGGANGLPALS